jgi:hypothetical protein
MNQILTFFETVDEKHNQNTLPFENWTMRREVGKN